jgi:hypothetical protein
MHKTPDRPSDSHAGAFVPLTEFGEATSLFARWQGRVEQISAGRFEGGLQIVSGLQLRLVRITGKSTDRARVEQGRWSITLTDA